MKPAQDLRERAGTTIASAEALERAGARAQAMLLREGARPAETWCGPVRCIEPPTPDLVQLVEDANRKEFTAPCPPQPSMSAPTE